MWNTVPSLTVTVTILGREVEEGEIVMHPPVSTLAFVFWSDVDTQFLTSDASGQEVFPTPVCTICCSLCSM
jgi:hypothetical protein